MADPHLVHARMGACTRRIASVSINTKATSLTADRAEHAAWCMPSPTRTPNTDQPSRVGDMDTLLAIASRRDERRTLPQPLSPELTRRVLDAGRLSGSSRN